MLFGDCVIRLCCFAEYYNPANAEFGVLRVLNDDLVKPKAGFGTHSHRDMEIFTYIVDEKLTHKDSIGTSETLGRGSVQYMSAGTGIRHSEMNNSDDLLRFLQIWIKPNSRGLKPNYGARVFKKEDRHNKIQPVLTDFKRYKNEEDLGEGVIPIHQDCNMYVSEADPGVEQDLVFAKKRQAYVVCIEGKLSVSDLVHLDTRGAVEIRAGRAEELPLQFKADETVGAHFLVIEMALEYNIEISQGLQDSRLTTKRLTGSNDSLQSKGGNPICQVRPRSDVTKL